MSTKPTISPKLIETYNGIIKDMAENYIPTRNYYKESPHSGVYIKRKVNKI